MSWLLSPSGWPTFADTDDEQTDLVARGYDAIAEASVPAAIAAFQAAESSPPSTQLPGWALAADVATALALKANASSLPAKLSIADISNPATAGGLALREALGRKHWADIRDFGATTAAADNAAAITAAIASLGAAGGVVFVPAGVWAVLSTVVVPGGVRLLGTSWDYAQVGVAPARGSILSAGTGFVGGAVVTLGETGGTYVSGKTGASMELITVMGWDLPQSAVRVLGNRARIRWCQIYRGFRDALHIFGQNCHVLDSVMGQNGVGDCVFIENQFDTKLSRCEMREGINGVHIEGGGPTMMEFVHIYARIPGSASNCVLVTNASVTENGQLLIVASTLEAALGAHVRIVPGAAKRTALITLTGNTFYQVAGVPSDTYGVVDIDCSAAGSFVRQIVATGNTFNGPYRALVRKIGSGNDPELVNVSHNVGSGWKRVAEGFTPTHRGGNASRYYNGTTTDNLLSSSSGKATLSGTGAQTAFTIAHGLMAAPPAPRVTPGSAAAAGDFYVTADATNITVTFTTAPAVGTGNVVLHWGAEL